jgi:restriction system protein
MFVSLHRLTADARQFADSVGMTLVEGHELLEIIRSGLASDSLELPVPVALGVPRCPACGREMVRRTARHGAPAGEDFWGCSTFPACRVTVSITQEVAGRR